jgi:hypothetical protein
VSLESYTLIFQFLEFLLKLIFDVEVSILQFNLQIVVLVEKVVELIHLKVQILLSHFQLSNLLLVSLHMLVQSQLLLLQNALLIS